METNPAASPGKSSDEDLRRVATHRLTDQDRTRDAFGGEYLVQPAGKIIHRPRERERARFPVRRWVPNEQASLVDEVLDLLLEETMVGGKTRQEDEPGLVGLRSIASRRVPASTGISSALRIDTGMRGHPIGDRSFGGGEFFMLQLVEYHEFSRSCRYYFWQNVSVYLSR